MREFLGTLLFFLSYCLVFNDGLLLRCIILSQVGREFVLPAVFLYVIVLFRYYSVYTVSAYCGVAVVSLMFIEKTKKN